MSLILRATVRSDPGLVRTNNEDCAHAGSWLVAVADGMGGLPAGEVASDIVIAFVAKLDHPPGDGDPLGLLREAVEAANEQIRTAAQDDPAQAGMGTTVTAALLADDRIALLNVGDSRGYLLSGGVLSQVTKDDTFVQSLVDRGVLAPQDARTHPQRSLVTRAVQGEPLSASAELVPVRAGDRLLLCSDGLSDYVEDHDIGRTLLREKDRDACAAELVGLAHAVGAPDNVTVIIADVEAH